MIRISPFLPLVAVLAACSPTYNPDTYATRAVQQANPADRGVIAGVRPVRIAADGTTGGATGAAAGGLVGSQTPGGGLGAAVGALGGAVFGGLVGTAVERASGDTTGFEYIIRKRNGDLVAVTQRDVEALQVGMRVLVIAGNQARVVIDYTAEEEVAAPAPAATPAATPAPTLPGPFVDPAPVPPSTPDLRSFSPGAATLPL
ncbi:glycine zipper domain-containing protein [Humitalea sp. 24SJ18S-53]|uniref:glycine zipper domain-containing protein n=1 Tax=Humitalea sp. 24SJ18S-53 TaxID=3422307 RepID=UPI003D6727FF